MYLKSIFGLIQNHFKSFIAILLISLLGSLVFVGLINTSTSMKKSVSQYIQSQNLYDIRLYSNYGFDSESIISSENKAELGYDLETTGRSKGIDYLFKIESIPNTINQFKLIEGRFPKNVTEVLLVQKSRNQSIFLNDKIEIDYSSNSLKKDVLSENKFQVVGVVETTQYLSNLIGNTNLGNGSIDYVIFVVEDTFKLEKYTHLDLTFENLDSIESFSLDYSKKLEEEKKKVIDSYDEKLQKQIQKIKTDGLEKIEEGRKKIQDEKKKFESEIVEAQEKIERAKSQIQEKRNELRLYQSQYEKGSRELESRYQLFLSTQKDKVQELNTLFDSQIQAITNQLQQVTNIVQRQNLQQQLDLLLLNKKNAMEKLNEELNLNQQRLDSEKEKLDASKVKIENGFFEIEKAKSEILNQEKEIESQKERLYQEIASQEQLLEEQQEKIDNMEKLNLSIMTRNENFGYKTFDSQANNMQSLASIFPFIFFIVAVFVVLVSMARLVQEQKMIIATLKSLGYSNVMILARYLSFSGIACLIGSVLGGLIGLYAIPYLIFETFRLLFILPKIQFNFDLILVVLTSLILLSVVFIATSIATYSLLKQNTANLLNAKVVLNGKKAIVERFSFFNRMKLFNRIMVRNIFYSKVRFLMMVFGIFGCMSLLVIGFGILENTKQVAHKQFTDLHHYQTLIKYDKGDDILKSWSKNNNGVDLYTENYKLEDESIQVWEYDELDGIVEIDTTKSVIISEKIAHLYNIKLNDTITIQDYSTNQKFTFQVEEIAKNYLGNYLFVNREKVKILNKANNTILLRNKIDKDQIKEELSSNQITTITTNDELIHRVKSMIDSIDLVVFVIVVFAGLLTFTVIYNLSNISISERLRELATMKVLGFYEKEVQKYIFKEIMLLVLMGIFVGTMFSHHLFILVVRTVETTNVSFSKSISILVYGYSILLIVTFTCITLYLLSFQVKKVNMLEALKSNE